MTDYRKPSVAVLLVLGPFLAACGPKAPVAADPAVSSEPSQSAKHALSRADLCRSLLSGQHLDTQSLLDLAYDINPTHSEPYYGADSACYKGAIRELGSRK